MGVLYSNPLDSPTDFNTIVVAAISFGPYGVMQGKFEFLEHEGRIFKWDVKDAPGVQGATITHRGSRPATFKGKFSFWTSKQIDDFYLNIIPLFLLDPSKRTVKPVDVMHPALSALDIYAVVAQNIGVLEHDGGGLYSVTISMLEYAPAKKKNATSTPNTTLVTAAKNIGNNVSQFFFGNSQADTFPDAQDKEQAALLAKANEP